MINHNNVIFKGFFQLAISFLSRAKMFPSLLRCFESFPQPQFGVILSLQVSARSHGCEKSQPKRQKMTSHGKKDSIGFTKLPSITWINRPE